MAFPSSNGTRRSLQLAYRQAKDTAFDVDQETAAVRSKAAAGTLKRFEALAYMTRMTDALDTLTLCAAQEGIAAYAQEQEADPALNIATEFNSMVTAITAARNWVVTNFPAASGYVQVYQITTGRYSDPGFTAAQLTNLLPLLDAILAAID